MPRYVLKKFNGEIHEGISWNKKSHAEAWIQKHLSLYGGLEWRVGALFKAKRDNQMEIVHAKSHKPVAWNNVEPAHEDEYTP